MFYKIQAKAFKNYFNKFSNRDIVSVFNEWAESKDFVDSDRQRIWGIVKNQENG